MITANVGNATVKNLVKLFYDITLNDIREAEIYTDGSDSTLNNEYDTSAITKIYKDGTLVFEGEVIEKKNTEGGGVILYCIGQEVELTETDAPVTGSTHSKVWTSTGMNTIFDDLVTEVSGWTTDVSNSTNTNLDSFKVTDSMSVWNAIIKFIKTTNKDFIINDSEKRLYLYDNKNRTGKAVFNEGVNCGNVTWTKKKAAASKVIVYGKGDGDNQIIGTAGSGTPVKKIVDRAIIATDEADTRATAELSLISNSIYHYTFNCYSPNEDVELGDTVILNASTTNAFDKSVDIVKIKRSVVNDTEKLSLQVTDSNHRIAKTNQTKIMFQNAKNYETSQSSMQGQRNVHPVNGSEICDASNPLELRFYIPSYVTDEVGNNRIKDIKLNYSLKNYKKIVNATEDATVTSVDDAVALTVDDTTETTANRVSGTSAPTQNMVEDTTPGSFYTQVTDFGDIEKSNIDDHHHDVSSSTSGVSIGTQADDAQNVVATFSAGSNMPSSFTRLAYVSNADVVDDEMMVIQVDISYRDDDVTDDYEYCYVRLETDTTPARHWPNSTGVLKRVYIGHTASFLLMVPSTFWNSTSTLHEVQFRSAVSGWDYCAMYNRYDIVSHTHTIPSIASGAEDEPVLLEKAGSVAFSVANLDQDTDSLLDGETKDGVVYQVVDTTQSTVSGTGDTKANRVTGTTGNTANRLTATLLDLTEVATTATGIKLYIDGTNRTTAVFGSDPHDQTEDEDIDITDYCDTPGWHIIQIYPQGDKAFTIAEVHLDFALDS